MNYLILFLLICILYFIFGVISPVLRNIKKVNEGMTTEECFGGFLVRKFYKKK